MKRKQHRFETEQEILDRIDSTKQKLISLRKQAEALDRFSGYNEELKKIDARCRRIEDSTLPQLKNALAAFRTEVLEFSKHDKGVVI